jgi:RNA polymerase sigma factor for flagellar operon FliA
VRLNPREIFLAQLPFIERVIESTCRRHLLRGDEADEFRSLVHEKLIEDDYAVLRKFQGASTLATYLTTVIKRLFLDYRNRRWGKWRPSAQARRLGPVAVQLEILISRDGLPAQQAVELVLHSSCFKVSRRELNRIARKLPVPRKPPRNVARRRGRESELLRLEEPDGPERRLLEQERCNAIARAWKVLEDAMRSLPEEDRLIVRMHLMDGFTIAEISRSLRLSQKPLYDRLRRSLEHLRGSLEKAGLGREEVVALLA